jgi:hypothetical protein
MPAIRQSNCMRLGAGHPPKVWPANTQNGCSGVQIEARVDRRFDCGALRSQN